MLVHLFNYQLLLLLLLTLTNHHRLSNAHSTYNNKDDLLHYQLITTHPTIHISTPPSSMHKKRDTSKKPSIHKLDELNINLVVFNQSLHFILTPELNLLHPNATVEVHHHNKTIETKPFDVRIYKGHVVDANAYRKHFSPNNAAFGHSLNILNSFPQDLSEPPKFLHDIVLGTVRLVLEHDGLSENHDLAKHYPSTTRKPVFHAHFDILGERYTITPIHTYNALRTENDPVIASHKVRRSLGGKEAAEATMIIYRDSDTRGKFEYQHSQNESKSQHLQKRLIERGVSDQAIESCGAGITQWNREQRVLHALGYPKLLIQNNFNTSTFQTNSTLRELVNLFSNPGNEHANHLMKRQRTQNPNQARAEQIGANGKCLSDLQFVYMGVAADCTYANSFQNSESAILSQLISVWGEVSAKYRSTLNIGVGIVNTVIKLQCGGPETWNVECDNGKLNILLRLTEFSKWRGSQQSDEGAWMLMSACNTGTTLGIAWTGTLCQRTAVQQPRAADPILGSPPGTDFVSSTGVSTITREQWKVVAHELGHIFGAIHDCTSQQCNAGASAGASLSDLQCAPCTDQRNSQGNCDCGGKFLMNPTDSAQAQDFSTRSVADMCTVSRRLLRSSTSQTCLLPPGSRNMLEGNKCGNGILERGEECDCGDNCATDKCCTNDCKFKPNAQCADSNSPGCCKDCKFKAQGSVCRPSNEFCDSPEFCPGTSAQCPPDTFKPNGTPCTVNSTLPIPPDTLNGMPTTCAAGLCTSRNLQCFEVSRGQRSSFTAACTSQQGSCSTTCADSRGICFTLDNNFVDGTSCGFSSECVSGKCSGFAPLNLLSSWVYSNTTIAMVVGVLMGLALLMCVYSCCIRTLVERGCRRVRGSKKMMTIPRMQQRQAYVPPPAQQPIPTMQSPPPMQNFPPSGMEPTHPPPMPYPPNLNQMYNDQMAYLSSNVARPYP